MALMALLPVLAVLARDFATTGYAVVRSRATRADDPAESGRGPLETMSEDITTLNAVAREELATTLTLAADDLREPLTELHDAVSAGRSPSTEDVAAARHELQHIEYLLNRLADVAE